MAASLYSMKGSRLDRTVPRKQIGSCSAEKNTKCANAQGVMSAGQQIEREKNKLYRARFNQNVDKRVHHTFGSEQEHKQTRRIPPLPKVTQPPSFHFSFCRVFQ